MSKRYKTLEQWIRETLSESREHSETGKEGACTAMALVYMKPQGGSVDLDIVKLTGKTWNPKDIADRFRGKAETYAQDMGGQQTFQVYGFFGSREPQAFHNFRVIDGEIASGGTDRGVKENPDATGLVASVMRHLERTQEMMLTLAQGFVARAADREEKLYAREDKMREEVHDATLIIREMIMDKRKDLFDMEMARAKFLRDSKNQDQMLGQVPSLINTISGEEVFPQSVADKDLVDKLCERVEPDQVDGLVTMGVITADMAGPLKLRIAKYREEQSKKAQALKDLPVAAGLEEENNKIVPFDKNKDKKGGGSQSGAPAAT